MDIHLTLITAKRTSHCPDCRREIRRGDPIACRRGGRYFICVHCVADQLQPLLIDLNPLPRAVDDLMNEYRLQDIAGLEPQPAVLTTNGSTTTWSSAHEPVADDSILLVAEPTGDQVKFSFHLPLQRYEVRPNEDER